MMASPNQNPTRKPSGKEAEGSVNFTKEENEAHLEEEGRLQAALEASGMEMANNQERFMRAIAELKEENGRLQAAVEASGMEMANNQERFMRAIAELKEENGRLQAAVEASGMEMANNQERFMRAIAELKEENGRLQAAVEASGMEMANNQERFMRAIAELKEENGRLQAAVEASGMEMANNQERFMRAIAELKEENGRLQAAVEASEMENASVKENLEKEKLVANHKVVLAEQMNKQLQEYNSTAQQYISALQADLKAAREENSSFKKKLEEEAKVDEDKKESQAMNDEAARERLMKKQLIIARMNDLLKDIKALEETCSSQRAQLHELQERLAEGEDTRKQMHNTILELKGNIRVFCRVRPLLPHEGAGTVLPVLSYLTSTEALGRAVDLNMTQTGQKTSFTFDKVFTEKASQEDVFVEISELVQSALDGHKVCIFAYGQTGSGKTFTMMGRPDSDQKGLIPRVLDKIFETSLTAEGWKYTMQVSMFEIYNESIWDLLSPDKSSFSAAKQYMAERDLTKVQVLDKGKVFSLLRQATQSRSVGQTMMNEASSRSHFVFTMQLFGFNEGIEEQVQGVIKLIDLTGSERLSMSGATGDRLKETQAINKSLSALSNVIVAMANKRSYIPFRDSTLTFHLKPYLEERDCKTVMLVHVSPHPSSEKESLNSLQFAAKANRCDR